MRPSAWSTQQLAEFLAVVSSSETEASAALAAVERAAEALDVEAAAIVCDGRLIAGVGYPDGAAPVAELGSVTPGSAGIEVAVPGVGVCPATAVSLEYPPGATLVLARSDADGLSPEEAALLRGMARVTSMTMRMLSLLDAERAAREESDRDAAVTAGLLVKLTERQAVLERLAEEQAALRRVATLVAGQAAADDIFVAVAREVGRLLRADAAAVGRYEPDGSMTVVAGWSEGGTYISVGARTELRTESLPAMVLRSGGSARLDYDEELSGPVAELMSRHGIRSSVGAPIVVEGRVWGVMIASSNQPESFPDNTESRIMGFTELVATAISNAASREQLAASRARIVATADQTRHQIERDLHDEIQQRLVTLTLHLQALKDSVPSDPPELLGQLAHVDDELRALLSDLREIARGVHPAILSEGGLGHALKALARRSTLPVELEVGALERLRQPVEVAAYYVVSEALANATKHANASVARVDLEVRNGALRLAIGDDGVGGADPAQGTGLLGLTDRVEALGGTIAVTSPPGAGTSMVVELPLSAAPAGRLEPSLERRDPGG
jgi:signal transduction histidine kinase